MSQEQLEDALLEQRVSRKRLGAILVENRVVTPHDLTSALQVQLREVTNDSLSDTEADEPVEPAQKRGLFRRRRGTAEDGASPPPSTVTVQELFDLTEAQNAELRRELAGSSSELEVARAEIARRDSRIGELETHLKELQRDRELLVGGLRLEIQELERDLRALGGSRSPASVGPYPTAPTPAGPRSTTPDTTYLLLAPSPAGGHTLRECKGSAPPPGTAVDYAGSRYVVASHRRSPLGVDDRVCVHLRAS